MALSWTLSRFIKARPVSAESFMGLLAEYKEHHKRLQDHVEGPGLGG
jgi:hypothetical protein